MERRTFLASFGTIGAASIGFHTLSSPARGAEITLDHLSVTEGNELVTSTVADARLSVDVSYEYNSNRPPDKCKIVLSIGTHPDEMYAIALQEGTESLPENESAQTTLEGSIFNAPDYEAKQLNPSPGGSSTVYMWVGVTLEVIANGQIQSEAYAEDDTSLGVENGSYSVTSSVGGSGSFEIVTE